ncbi:acetyl-CoA carboxylase biotin carboxyl carrier protein subunit [Jiangella anatolica]|uniref:Acetyl-CoA carboxylase biotin carboxyl carrier protein subunit n=1 Tax=Jiangella anatolica TaxID=2670374 RepID=A0A2W2B8G5_9ACTN|nr:acetyl-CoA carboxylase biotin carboxyl carrier protein subunit [Jiangella anatolica]PZF82352.1 acetyl-CoA carboxylase biotin carboxyl carrier protein subunit [Jiangella anatolica]
MEICADLPAVVLELGVAVGDAVDAGQVVAVLESMKLEIPIETPASGTVTAVHVAVGETVDDGQVLVELGE